MRNVTHIGGRVHRWHDGVYVRLSHTLRRDRRRSDRVRRVRACVLRFMRYEIQTLY